MEIVKSAPEIKEGEAVCGNCDFYKPSEGRDNKGVCHYNPPSTHMVMLQGTIQGSGTPSFISSFPTVNTKAFCSKFQQEIKS